VKECLIREDEVEGAILVLEIIETGVVDSEVLLGDAYLFGHLSVVIVFFVRNVGGYQQLQPVEFEELFTNISGEASPSTS